MLTMHIIFHEWILEIIMGDAPTISVDAMVNAPKKLLLNANKQIHNKCSAKDYT